MAQWGCAYFYLCKIIIIYFEKTDWNEKKWTSLWYELFNSPWAVVVCGELSRVLFFCYQEMALCSLLYRPSLIAPYIFLHYSTYNTGKQETVLLSFSLDHFRQRNLMKI